MLCPASPLDSRVSYSSDCMTKDPAELLEEKDVKSSVVGQSVSQKKTMKREGHFSELIDRVGVGPLVPTLQTDIFF